MKLIYKIRNSKTNELEDKIIVSKILQMGKNNQYGNEMGKPFPPGSIKNWKTPTMRQVGIFLQGISDEDKIGHLFNADIKFHEVKADEKRLLFNEI